MIKKFAINKIAVSTLCLVLLAMFYFLPTHENINTQVNTNEKGKENIVYLLDDDNYVSRVIAYFDEDNIEGIIKKKIDILTHGSEEVNNFHALIPKDTKLNSVKVEKNNVYLDFSKELLSVNKYIEESMIEAIIYTLTEINGIDNIYINVENEKLDKLPSSQKTIPYPLTREYGINKEYDLSNLTNITKTTIFFSKKIDDETYYVPVTKINNENDEKIQIIIKELKSSINAQNNLNSTIEDKLKLISFSNKDNEITLVFNQELDNVSKTLIENSVFENYDVDKINYDILEKE